MSLVKIQVVVSSTSMRATAIGLENVLAGLKETYKVTPIMLRGDKFMAIINFSVEEKPKSIKSEEIPLKVKKNGLLHLR